MRFKPLNFLFITVPLIPDRIPGHSRNSCSSYNNRQFGLKLSIGQAPLKMCCGHDLTYSTQLVHLIDREVKSLGILSNMVE